MIDSWPQASGLEDADVDQVQEHLVQSVVRTAHVTAETAARGRGHANLTALPLWSPSRS